MMTEEELQKLQRAVKALPPKTQLALMMVREGNGYEEVAAELGINTRSARKLVERAMEFLLERQK